MTRLPSAALLLAGAFALARPAGAGTGAGNEFSHHFNQAFDFHVASPKDWPCSGCDAEVAAKRLAEEENTWLLAAPEVSTWMKISFIADFPAESEAELKKEITARHEGVEWHAFERGSFVGFSTSPAGTDANAALEYYLVAKRQVIRLEWQKDGARPDRALQLDAVKDSVERVSEPPRINSIHTEKDAAYEVGETACHLVEVDDLRNAFNAGSLKTFEIDGVPAHWSFKRIEWLAEKGAFRVCHKVSAAFGPSDLNVKSVTIEDDDGRTVDCRRDSRKETLALECFRWPQESSNQQPRQVLMPRVAAVKNPAPDQEGPKVRAVTFDPEAQTVSITADDQNGVYVGELLKGEERVVAYPDQLRAGRPISIATLVRAGWNTLDAIVLYDGNGIPTLLRKQGGGKNGVERYELVPWHGAPQPTDIPVVSFLKTSGVRQ